MAEITRHRHVSFNIECLSKDTLIYRYGTKPPFTIKELYDLKNSDCRYSGKLKLIDLRSMDENTNIVPNKIIDIYKSGIKPVYKLSTKLGYSIRSTLNHRFFNKDGEIFLKDLKIGNKILVNGEEYYKNKKWLYDKNPTHNDRKNILLLCKKCHKLIHKGIKVKHVIEDEIISIDYIGDEETYDIEMQYPYHNFVANGFIVHNSTRYVNYKEGVEFILPIEFYKENIKNAYNYNIWLVHMKRCEIAYKEMIEKGCAPQLARSVLPNSLKTNIIMKTNLRDWINIFKLRTASGAHPQMKALMNDLLKQFKERIPIIFDEL